MVVRIQNHNINYVADPLLEIKKQDWIILRLLYLITAIDPTMNKVDEVKKSMDYINKRYRPYMDTAAANIVDRAFWMVSKDPVAQDTFSNVKDVRLVRDFKRTFGNQSPYEDNIKYFGTVNYTIKPGNKDE